MGQSEVAFPGPWTLSLWLPPVRVQTLQTLPTPSQRRPGTLRPRKARPGLGAEARPTRTFSADPAAKHPSQLTA